MKRCRMQPFTITFLFAPLNCTHANETNVSEILLPLANTTVDSDLMRLQAGTWAATALMLDCVFGIFSFIMVCTALERCYVNSLGKVNPKKYDGPDTPTESERDTARSLPAGIEIVTQR